MKTVIIRNKNDRTNINLETQFAIIIIPSKYAYQGRYEKAAAEMIRDGSDADKVYYFTMFITSLFFGGEAGFASLP